MVGGDGSWSGGGEGITRVEEEMGACEGKGRGGLDGVCKISEE